MRYESRYSNTSLYLEHHGIKGQKWGRRRYQNQDGSLTPAGELRYDKDGDRQSGAKENFFKRKSREHRSKLESQYRKAGATKSEAQKLADNRIKTERVLAGVAAVSVAAIVATAAYKHHKETADKLIKSGTEFQRIEGNHGNATKLHDIFYASEGKHDNRRYKNILGYQRQAQYGEAYMMKFKNEGSIKVASKGHARKAFMDLYNGDSDFRSNVNRLVQEDWVNEQFNGKTYRPSSGSLKGRQAKDLYERFNVAVVDSKARSSGVTDKFFGKLKGLGYGAIEDINDQKFSGYNSDHPYIVFDKSKFRESASDIKVSKLDPFDLMSNYYNEIDNARSDGERKALKQQYDQLFKANAYATAASSGAYYLVSKTKSPNQQEVQRYRNAQAYKNRKGM